MENEFQNIPHSEGARNWNKIYEQILRTNEMMKVRKEKLEELIAFVASHIAMAAKEWERLMVDLHKIENSSSSKQEQDAILLLMHKNKEAVEQLSETMDKAEKEMKTILEYLEGSTEQLEKAEVYSTENKTGQLN